RVNVGIVIVYPGRSPINNLVAIVKSVVLSSPDVGARVAQPGPRQMKQIVVGIDLERSGKLDKHIVEKVIHQRDARSAANPGTPKIDHTLEYLAVPKEQAVEIPGACIIEVERKELDSQGILIQAGKAKCHRARCGRVHVHDPAVQRTTPLVRLFLHRDKASETDRVIGRSLRAYTTLAHQPNKAAIRPEVGDGGGVCNSQARGWTQKCPCQRPAGLN